MTTPAPRQIARGLALAVAACLLPILLWIALVLPQDGVSGAWIGPVQVSALGTLGPPPGSDPGNAVLELHLIHPSLFHPHLYRGTALLVTTDGAQQTFSILDLAVTPLDTFYGFMVSGPTGGSFSGRIQDGRIILTNQTHTRDTQMQGILTHGTHARLSTLLRSLTPSR